MYKMIKQLFLFLSYANLCFLQVWYIYSRPPIYFDYPHHPYDAFYIIAIMFLIFASGTLLFLCNQMISKFSNIKSFLYVIPISCVSIGFIQLKSIVEHYVNVNRLSFPGTFTFLGILILLGILAAVFWKFIKRYWRPVFHMGIQCCLLFCLAMGMLRLYLREDVIPKDYQLAELYPVSQKNDKRVLWIIFDEMDIRVAFEHPPEGFHFNNLEAFRKEAFFATNAYAPGPRTAISLPALITGNPLKEVNEYKKQYDLLLLSSEDNVSKFWSEEDNIFRKARLLGVNTALIGFFHPYLRLMKQDLNYCLPTCYPSKVNFREALADCTETFLWKCFPLQIGGREKFYQKEKRAFIHLVKTQIEAMRDVIRNADYGLTFLHVFFPHNPGLYNSKDDTYTDKKDGSYFDNMVLVDRFFGKMRKTMEEDGLWDKTTVIVMSDHWLRDCYAKKTSFVPEDYHKKYLGDHDKRVPFVVKLAGQKNEMTYVSEFNSLLVHNAILDILRGKVKDENDLVYWLDNHRLHIPLTAHYASQ